MMNSRLKMTRTKAMTNRIKRISNLNHNLMLMVDSSKTRQKKMLTVKIHLYLTNRE